MNEGRLDLGLLEGLTRKMPALLETPEVSETDEFDETPADLSTGEKQNIIGEIESLEAFHKANSKLVKTVKNTPDGSTEAEVGEDTDLSDSEDDQDAGDSEGSSDSYSPVKAISEWAKANNLFDYKDEEFEDTEDFVSKKLTERVTNDTEKGITDYKEALPPAIKELITNYEDGVPLDHLIYSQSREMEYKALKPEDITEDEELQKSLISDYLGIQEYSEDEIKAKLDRMSASGILPDEAQDAHKKLIRYQEKYQESLKEQAKARKEKDQERVRDQVKEIENQIDTSDEILPGIKLSKEEKEKLKRGYTQMDKSGQTELTKRLKEDKLANLKIAQLFLLLNGDLTKIEEKLGTKVAKQTKQTVNTYKDSPLSKLDIAAWRKSMARMKR